MAGHIQLLPQVHRRTGQGRPADLFGNEEFVLIHIGQGNLPGHALPYRRLHLLLEAVRQPLQEQDGEDVVLVIGGVDLAAQNVRRLPEFRLQFLLGY